MSKIILFFIVIVSFCANAQELNCVVKVNTETLNNNNLPIFKTLEKSLNEFVNKTKFTTLNVKAKEKIDCSMFINITSYNSDQFTATIQIQSSRPIFNASYSTPVFNYNDKDFSFRYSEYEPIFYNPNSFDSNLVSVLAFYSTIIIGLDGDTFAPMGGKNALALAQEIVNLAQGSNFKGWTQSDGNQNRYFLINDLLSNTFLPIRQTLYDYHFKGLDTMSEDVKGSKEKIKSAILALEEVNALRPNAFVTRVFFDAKSDEIQSIFSSGPPIKITDLVDNLNRISPLNASKWAEIRM